MACPAPCRGCLEAGRCPNGPLPASAVPAPPRPRTQPRRAVRASTTDTPRGPVAIKLVCGHRTTSDAALFYSVWQPRPDEGRPLLYCETCQAWTRVEAAQVTREPSEPMF